MGTSVNKSTALIVFPALLLLVALLQSSTAAKVTDQELEAAFAALRSHGYTLFPNAVATSDIRPLLLSSNSTFTLFSPPDPHIFSLDLSCAAPEYIRYLHRHLSPSILSTSDLRKIVESAGPYQIETLVPHQPLSIDKSLLVLVNSTVLETVSVDNIRVTVPDLFVGSAISVHGLEGILVSGLESGLDLEGHRDYSAAVPSMSPIIWNSPSPRNHESTGKVTKKSRPKGKNSPKTANRRGIHRRVARKNGDSRHFKYAMFNHRLGI